MGMGLLFVDEFICGQNERLEVGKLGVVFSQVGCKVKQKLHDQLQTADMSKDSRSSKASAVHGTANGRQKGIRTSHVQSRNVGVGCCRPVSIDGVKHGCKTHGAVTTSMPASKEVHFRKRGTQVMIRDFSFDLWNSFVEDIQQMLRQCFLEIQIVCSAVLDLGALPFFKPLPEPVAGGSTKQNEQRMNKATMRARQQKKRFTYLIKMQFEILGNRFFQVVSLVQGKPMYTVGGRTSRGFAK